MLNDADVYDRIFEKYHTISIDSKQGFGSICAKHFEFVLFLSGPVKDRTFFKYRVIDYNGRIKDFDFVTDAVNYYNELG